MHKTLAVLLLVSILVLGSAVSATPGRTIPIPDVTIERALELARTEHKKMVSKSGDHALVKEMIIVSVEYLSPEYIIKEFPASADKISKAPRKDKWQWIVCFKHPTHTDVSHTYLVTQEGEVICVGVAW